MIPADMPFVTAVPLDPYDELELEASAVGWPLSFKTDLTEHDKPRLQGGDAPKIFGWVLRKLGTLLLDPRMSRSSLDGYTRHLTEPASDAHRYYWHNGRALKEVDRDRMLELLRKHHNPTGADKHSIY